MGATVGTRLMTWWKGQEVGTDSFGNRYFKEKSAGNRRWVIYEGEPEAAKVPAEWHAWLHHTMDEVPTAPREEIAWEKPHVANLTGTSAAYRPGGSVLSDKNRQKSGGDYQAWTPE